MNQNPTRRSFLAHLSVAVAAATAGRTLLAADGAKRRPRILLRSGWQTVNIGDIGHTPGMLALLAEHLPGVDVTLFASDAKSEGVAGLFAKYFPNLPIVSAPADVKRAMAESDFLLHGSGPSLVGARTVVQWHREVRKPWGVVGITFQAAQAKDPEIKAAMDAAAFAYFRDTISLGVAKDAGIACPVMEYGPDAAFAVATKDEARADAILTEHRLEPGRFLCVIPRLRNSPYWWMKGKGATGKPTEPVTDADKAKHAENERMKEADHGMVRPAVVEFVRRTGMKVLLCPEDVSHVWVGKEMFLDKLPDDVRPRVAWLDRYWLTDAAVATYARAFGLLSMDMHSPIMALGQGTPAIVCRFRQQTSKGQMWNDIGLNDWLFDLDVEKDGSRVTQAVMAMAADPAAARAKAAKGLAFVRERQRAAMGALKKQVGG